MGTTSRIHVRNLKYTESYVWNTGRDNTIFKTKLDREVNIKVNLCKKAWEVSDWIN